MNSTVSPLLKRYNGKPVILDTNVLLLYWCDSFDTELIHTFKRLNAFSAKDIDLLHRTLRRFPSLNTTPHVLTEVSNLAKSLPRWRREDWTSHFARQIDIVAEKWTSAKTLAHTPASFLGLADAALCELASTHVILTIDFPLTNYLESKKLNVVNFNHLREAELSR